MVLALTIMDQMRWQAAKFLKTKSAMLQVFLDPQSLILFGTPNTLLLWTQFPLIQDLLTAHTKFPSDTPT